MNYILAIILGTLTFIISTVIGCLFGALMVFRWFDVIEGTDYINKIKNKKI